MKEAREPEPVASLVGKLAETICRFITQEVGGAIRRALRDARAPATTLVIGATLVVLGIVFVLTGAVKVLMLAFPPWGAYLVAGGVALLAGCAVLLTAKGRSRGEAEEDGDGEA